MQTWIEEETKDASWKDPRLKARYQIILDRLSAKPSLSIPAACGSWNDTLATYRFCDHQAVDLPTVLQPHTEATLRRCQEQQVVLSVQDTTELDCTRPEQQMLGVGPLNEEYRLGLHCHAMMAFTPGRIPLGLLWVKLWARDMDTMLETKGCRPEKEKRKKQKPIEDKESFRWLEGYRVACQIAEQMPQTKVVQLSDSEGDIFECLGDPLLRPKAPRGKRRKKGSVRPLRAGKGKAYWIVRACQNRSTLTEQEKHVGKLWEEAMQAEVLGYATIEVSHHKAKPGKTGSRNQARAARTTEVSIRAAKVVLRGPWRVDGSLEDIEVHAVLVREEQAPEGEEPVEWLLLTDLPIDTYEQVSEVVEYYGVRWQIEVYFRVLKSGCRVEESQLERVERYEVYVGLKLVVSWRVLHVLMLGRAYPELPCEVAFSEAEWRSVYTVVSRRRPQSCPTMGEMVVMVAKLGGYLGRKGDGPPGPKTTWIGMQRMADMALTLELLSPKGGAAERQQE